MCLHCHHDSPCTNTDSSRHTKASDERVDTDLKESIKSKHRHAVWYSSRIAADDSVCLQFFLKAQGCCVFSRKHILKKNLQESERRAVYVWPSKYVSSELWARWRRFKVMSMMGTYYKGSKHQQQSLTSTSTHTKFQGGHRETVRISWQESSVTLF